MSTKRNIQFLKGYIPCKSIDNMKTLDLVVGDVVHIANNYTFYVIEDATSDEAIPLPNSLFAKPIPNPIAPTSPDSYTVDTIEKLKGLSFLKEGDVVEVLGYYQAGDGAGHQRIIASEDDGSGVLLKNGLYANIVHNGTVNVRWLGITKDTLADDNKTVINKVISEVKDLKNLVLDTDFYCHEIEIVRDLEISGIFKKNISYTNTSIINQSNDKNTIIFKEIRGSDTTLSNFNIKGGKNGIFSEFESFNPKLDGITCVYCSEAGINHTPNEKYNTGGLSNSFCYSYMKNLILNNNKYGILLDHSKVPLRESWSNSNSIEYSNINSNEVGIYVKGMDRMECWQIKNSDLNNNGVGANKTSLTLERYKEMLSNNKYGVIILESCVGCDIELDTAYIEFAGDLATVGTNSPIGNTITSNGSQIYSDTYEYDGVIYLNNDASTSAVASSDRKFAMFNLLNTRRSKIICSNCWLTYCNDVFKSSGGDGFENGFITKNSNTMRASYTYLDQVRGIFNLENKIGILDISKETSIDKEPNKVKYIIPQKIPSYCRMDGINAINCQNVNQKNVIDWSVFSDNVLIHNFIGTAEGFISVKGTCILPNNTSGYFSERKTNGYIYGSSSGEAVLVFDSSKTKTRLSIRAGMITFENITFKFIGGGEIEFGSFSDAYFKTCKFDFTEFSGTLTINWFQAKFQGCTLTGNTPKLKSIAVLTGLSNSENFFWNDFVTVLPTHISSYPQGHGFNLNGVDYVRKGSRWVKASDGTTQALSEVIELDTSYYSRLMEQEGIINDYDNYRLALSEYNKQEEIEFEHSMKAYNDYLATVADKDNIMTYEEFEQQHGNNVMMNLSLVERLEEPVIPESVQKFMEKYLGTTPTPKAETKPKTFSFDEVDKLNDTLKKL